MRNMSDSFYFSLKNLSFLLLVLLGCSGSVARDLPDFTVLVEKYSPAVVKIQSVSLANQQIISQVGEEPLALGLGSGFIIESDGYILTNHHVVAGADKVVVRLSDRREFDARLVGSDAISDIALLKVQATGLPTLQLSKEDDLMVGEWVLAIGSPFGLDYSVSQGIVSAMGRSLPGPRNENYVPFIQTDVAINPGNSGGPLINLDGEVVGINSQIFTQSGGSVGLSFAIPASVARNVVSQLKEHGVVSRGWLGVSIQELDQPLASSFGLSKPEGALIAQVVAGGPAAKGGLLVGDIVIAFNGKPILFSSDLPHQVGMMAPGAVAQLMLVRNGKQLPLELKVGELPDNQSVQHQYPGARGLRIR